MKTVVRANEWQVICTSKQADTLCNYTKDYLTCLSHQFVVSPEFKPGINLFHRYIFPHYEAGTDHAMKVQRQMWHGCLPEGVSDESVGMDIRPVAQGLWYSEP